MDRFSCICLVGAARERLALAGAAAVMRQFTDVPSVSGVRAAHVPSRRALPCTCATRRGFGVSFTEQLHFLPLPARRLLLGAPLRDARRRSSSPRGTWVAVPL
jgi:hypothetical protein